MVYSHLSIVACLLHVWSWPSKNDRWTSNRCTHVDIPIIDTQHTKSRQGRDGLGDDDVEFALLHMGELIEGTVDSVSSMSLFLPNPKSLGRFPPVGVLYRLGILHFRCYGFLSLTFPAPLCPYELMGAEMLPGILGLILPFLEFSSTVRVE